MTTPIKPTPKQAVIFNQDTLYDYAQLGGSVEALLDEQIRAGKRVVVIQEASNSPREVVMVLETMEDFARWKESRVKTRDWLKKILGEP
jgi:hypothetical protein